MTGDRIIVQLLNQRFDMLEKRLDVIDGKNDQRDLRVNAMDADNKSEIGKLKAEMSSLRTAWKVVCTIFTAAIGFMGWVISQGIHVWDAVHRS